MDPAAKPPASLEFGRFRVLPHRREVLADGEPLKLGSRAFDVLMALIDAGGAVASRDTLMARVWPDRVVDENALQVQISALRVAFGAERELIRTVSGRGYQFTGAIRFQSGGSVVRAGPATDVVAPGSAISPTNLPEPVSELIGRDAELREVVSLAVRYRLITVTGPGGIGKTRLALAVARELRAEFKDGVWLAELAPLSDPGLVPTTVAAATGVELGGSAASPERVANALIGKQLLLVLDSCEHVVAAAATMAEAVMRAGSGPRIIATSRESLRAEGEQIYPVPPLSVPPLSELTEDAVDGDDFLRYGAARLFLDRMTAAAPRFAPDRPAAAVIATICRRLDGIPLAIELAAALASALGIEQLAARLDDRFHLLTGGRRTALPRHRTLRATFDWSFELLPESEQVILRRLAVFAGSITLEAVRAVVASAELPPSDVVEGVANLVAKSLVAANLEIAAARYSLLETTRAYALEKLAESGERERLARRHGEYYRDLFERAETKSEWQSAAPWLADYWLHIANLRAALDWAFSPGGDASIGVALTAAAVPLWMHLSLLEECRGRVEQALASMAAGAGGEARREMKLQAAFAASLMYTRGAVPEIGAAWTRALEIAESLDDTEHQLRSLWGLWSFRISGGQFRAALDLARRFLRISADPSGGNDHLIGERMIGVSQHYLGDQRSARHHIERVLAHYVSSATKSHVVRFLTDQRVTTRVFLSRVLWLQGFPDQAIRTVEESIEEARIGHHAMSLCYALAQGACPVALWVGDLAAAERYVEMLLDDSSKHALPLWRAWGRSYQGVLVIRQGDVDTGLRLLQAGLDELNESRSALRVVPLLAELAEGLGRSGLIADGLAAIDEALAHSDRTEERWFIAGLLVIRGDLLLSQGMPDAAADHFRRALDWAHRQGALSLELRAATRLAALLRDQGWLADAAALLQQVCDRFTEGFNTADLKTARALLDRVSDPPGRDDGEASAASSAGLT